AIGVGRGSGEPRAAEGSRAGERAGSRSADGARRPRGASRGREGTATRTAKSRAVRLACVAAAIAALGWATGRAGLPSSYLFGAILIGIALSLGAPRALGGPLPAAIFPAAQAVAGVVVGTYLHTSTLTALGARWIPVA